MLPTKTACIGFVVATTVLALLTRVSAADEGAESRAARVCARIAPAGPRSAEALKIDDLNIQRGASGAVTLRRGGIKLGEIAQNSYVDHTVCLVEVMALISSKI